MKASITLLFALTMSAGSFLLPTSSANAQANDVIAVEVIVLNKQQKPVTGATAYLYQLVPPGGRAFGTGSFTDASGVAVLQTPDIGETFDNVVEVLCMDKKGRRYTQSAKLYPILRTDRVYYRTVYLDTPSTVTACFNR